MDRVFAVLSTSVDIDDPIGDLVSRKPDLPDGAPIYLKSIHKLGQSVIFLARNDHEKFLVNLAKFASDLDPDFEGAVMEQDGLAARKCPLIHANAECLRRKFEWARPGSLRERPTTFGLGDRLGLATAGQLRAVMRHKVSPVLAQQSVRELKLTNRTFQEVVDAATFMVAQEGFTHGWGADGDHLKSIEEIDQALDARMSMITLDCSEKIHPEPLEWDEEKVAEAFNRLPERYRDIIDRRYSDRRFSFDGDVIEFPALEAHRAVLVYGEALQFVLEVWEHIRQRGSFVDLELSIDETDTPTLPLHHILVAAELECARVKITSLAPRFVGIFEKGVDYAGDMEEFERQFRLHCAIARTYGNYKISLHSGSDKFSIYPIVSRYTRNRFHVKTSGTSWLEALRLIAREEPHLYRQMHQAALASIEESLKLYHISSDFNRIPDVETLDDGDLAGLLDMPECRQMLHISYGALLNDAELCARFLDALHQREDGYYKLLERHIGRHLRELNVHKR